MNIFKILKKNNGFTLIELMVATTIFSIVMLMGVGALIVASNSAKAAQRLRIAMDNVNFAMESMTRELRTGTHYYSNSSSYSVSDDNLVGDYSGGEYVALNPQQVTGSPKRVAYFRVLRGSGPTHSLNRCEYFSSSNNNCYPVVADNVDVQDLKFYVKGSGNDTIQPSVRIIMKGSVTIGGVSTPFFLQSMASQRSTEN